ncbi:hypothetical protein [Mycobacteroides franklinii]|uniref:Secreted protein n=1 Tax=Mycobacteroides franklinii TaxID=948102 RepID=A0A4R5P8R4_9MYCO|nr:hypothetical protein [Mycobacteroides franklinii]ORA63589.1 hypothetical protein BST24_04350 [Mycobacteroides franklinii]TDH19511.1 hypothetical protein EJ571_23550 [Mycobacteroides franklinii]
MTGRSIGIISAFVSAVALVVGLFSSVAVASAAPDTAETHIRSLIAGQLSALQAVDAAAYGATYCADYRDKVEADHSQMFTPPDVTRLAGASVKKLRAKTKEIFPMASSDAVEAFVQAVGDEDQNEVDTAWHQLWASSFAKLSYRVKSVDVTGDNAEAIVAVRVGSTSTNQRWDLIREGQDWKDCTAPPEQDNVQGIVGGQGRQGLLDTPLTGE